MTTSSRTRILFALAAVTAGVLVGVQSATPHPTAKKLVTVTATDKGFRLSSTWAKVGVVTYTVVNRGKKRHNFRIAGKKTPILAPGKKAKLAVKFTRAGNYPYVSTVSGDVRSGLKGVFSITPPTTVTVKVTDTAFRLSAKTAPVGMVGFVVTNTGSRKHNFRIAAKKTPVLAPRTTAALIVAFKRAGKYAYVSTVAGDVRRGLKGVFTVKAAAPPPSTNLAAGKQVFISTGCGACHTLKAAGTSGTVGPNLDTSSASRATVVNRVTNGKGAMPTYKATLSAQQIQDVADFVVGSRG